MDKGVNTVKATGIVRRIDDLGRVVIPKEIRRTMHIREGAPLEIFTNDEGDVIFRKYSPLGEFPETAALCAEALWRTARYPAFVCDRERVVAASGPNKREITGKRISPELDRKIQERGGDSGEPFAVPVSADLPDTVNVIVPIIAASDVIGCVALAVPPETAMNGMETDRKFAEIASAFLSKQVEE